MRQRTHIAAVIIDGCAITAKRLTRAALLQYRMGGSGGGGGGARSYARTIIRASDRTKQMGREVSEARDSRTAEGGGLTAQQQALVDNMLTGAMSQTEAGIAAGYSSRSATSRAWASESVQAAFSRECLVRLRDQIPLAIAVRGGLLAAESELVRLKAVQDVLDRAGIMPPKAGAVTIGAVNVSIRLD